jgi:hypothetical protein
VDGQPTPIDVVDDCTADVSSFPYLLIAAVAEREQVTLVHYDSDYELIAEVTRQPMQWGSAMRQRALTHAHLQRARVCGCRRWVVST